MRTQIAVVERQPVVLHLLVALFVVASSSGTPALGQSPPPAQTFNESTDVVLLELDLDVADRRDRPVDELTLADLEVLVDGEPVPMIALERQATVSRAAVAERPSTDPGASTPTTTLSEQPWEIVIWADRHLSRPRSIPRVAAELRKRAAELAALGRVDVVVSDTSPHQLLAGSRDPKAIEKALDELETMVGYDTIRRERENMLEDAALTSNRTKILLIRQRLKEERRLITSAMSAFGDELVQRGPETSRRLAILVGDGFDLDSSSVAAAMGGDGDLAELEELRRQLQADTLELGLGPEVQALGERLAATGWTILAAADGALDVPGGAGADRAHREVFRRHMAQPNVADVGRASRLIDDPLGGLTQLADATGGLVRTGAKGTAAALERLAGRWRLTIQIPRPAEVLSEIDVRSRRPGLVIAHRRFVGPIDDASRATMLARRSLLGRESEPATLGLHAYREEVAEESPRVWSTKLVIRLEPAPRGVPGAEVGQVALAVEIENRPPLVATQPLVVPPLGADGTAPEAVELELTVRTRDREPRMAVGVVDATSGLSGSAVVAASAGG